MPTPGHATARYLYVVNDKGIVSCLDAKTGAEVYGPQRLKPGTYSASPVLADGQHLRDERGRHDGVYKAGPNFELLAENPLDDYTLSSFAVSSGAAVPPHRPQALGLRRDREGVRRAMSRRWPTVVSPVGIAVGLLIGEGVLRWAFPSYRDRFRTYTLVESERGKFARYDSMLGWSGREDAVGTFEWLDCRHEVRQNRFGWRGPAYEPDRAKASRLVVLGDSFVWGFGVEEADLHAPPG